MRTTFVDDDLGYELWLRSHSTGFALNCGRRPKSDYLMLHRATCHTVSGSPTRGDTWTTSVYMKVTASSIAELEAWALVETGGQVRRCGSCVP